MCAKLRGLALLAAVACFAAALSYRFEMHASGDGETRRHEVGIPGSP